MTETKINYSWQNKKLIYWSILSIDEAPTKDKRVLVKIKQTKTVFFDPPWYAPWKEAASESSQTEFYVIGKDSRWYLFPNFEELDHYFDHCHAQEYLAKAYRKWDFDSRVNEVAK